MSVSLPAEELEWAQSMAKAERVSLSAVVAHALRVERQMQARKRVVARLGLRSTQKQREAARREWRG